MIMNEILMAKGQYEPSYDPGSNISSSLEQAQYNNGAATRQPNSTRWYSEEIQENDFESLLEGVGEEISLKSLYRKAVHFALHQFWDLKVHIRQITLECDSLEQKQMEIRNITGPLKSVTDLVNRQVNQIAVKMTQNVTFDQLVDPVEKIVVDSISTLFKQINRSLHESRPEIENHCKYLEMLSEVNAADEKINTYYSRTCRYLKRVKMEILKLKKNSVSQRSRTPPKYPRHNTKDDEYPPTENQYSHNANNARGEESHQRPYGSSDGQPDTNMPNYQKPDDDFYRRNYENPDAYPSYTYPQENTGSPEHDR